MKSVRRCGTVFAVLLGMTVGMVTAQERRQGAGGPPPYDPKAEVTISGTVEGTETIAPPDRPEQTILLLTVDSKPYAIFLGPTAWVSKQTVTFAKGAAVEVVGNTGFKYNGRPAMQPRTVKAGNRTLTLRAADGKPMWQS